MPRLSVTLEVKAPLDQIFAYLSTRHEAAVYQLAAQATKGYLPAIECLEFEKDRTLTYRVAGRDALLKFPVSGWTWGYVLESRSAELTRVKIWYRWGIFLSFISLWTARFQAANELSSTALALHALEFVREGSGS